MPSWDSSKGYKAGNLQGFADVAAFYTQYKDMVEFQFGLFNNADLSMINSVTDAIQMLKNGKGFGIGAGSTTCPKHRFMEWKSAPTACTPSTKRQAAL